MDTTNGMRIERREEDRKRVERKRAERRMNGKREKERDRAKKNKDWKVSLKERHESFD